MGSYRKIVLASLALLASFLAVQVYRRYHPRPPALVDLPTLPSQSPGPVSRGSLADTLNGQAYEVVIIFIGANWCAGMSDPRLPAALRTIHRKVGNGVARDPHLRLRTIAIWMSDDPMDTRPLERFGPFDEVVAGGRWLSLGTIRYLWRDVPGEPTLPQVVITSRPLSFGPGSITVGQEDLMARFVGTQSIVRWSASPRIGGLVDHIARQDSGSGDRTE